jgi:integrase/recombinase XerC
MDGDGDLSAFLAYLRANRGLSGNTVKAYGTDVRECLHALASRGIADLRQVTTDDLRGWMAFETRDHARSSMARKVVSVRSFFAWAHEHGRIEADPAAVLMTPKLPDTLPSVLTEAQAERLMDRVDDDASLHAASSQRYETRHDEMPRLDSAHRGEGMSQRDEVVALRDAAMLELLYATGIRVAELVGLDIGDVDWSHRTIRVTGKGSKQRVVPFGDPAEKALAGWKEHGRPLILRRAGAGTLDTAALFLGMRGTQAVWSLSMIARVFYAAAASRSTHIQARPKPDHLQYCRMKAACPACAGEINTVFETRQS